MEHPQGISCCRPIVAKQASLKCPPPQFSLEIHLHYLNTERAEAEYAWVLLCPAGPVLPPVLELAEGVAADAKPEPGRVPRHHVLPRLLTSVVPQVGIRPICLYQHNINGIKSQN